MIVPCLVPSARAASRYDKPITSTATTASRSGWLSSRSAS